MNEKHLNARPSQASYKPLKWLLPFSCAVFCCDQRQEARAQDMAPLPAPGTVIDRVLARSEQEKADALEFKRRYTYDRSRTTERRNGKGELLNREVSKDRHVPGPAAGQVSDSKPKKSKHGSRDVAVDREMLSRFVFTVVEREAIEGRRTLVLDFVPVGNAPEHNLTDRFINRIAGRVWIDETESAMTRIEFHLTEKVNFVGGIAGCIRAFRFDSQRGRTAEGLWFTKGNRWHLDTRELLVNRSTDYLEELAEVRPLPVAAAK